MNHTTGQAAGGQPHELRFSQGNWIVFLILMVIGWFSGLDESESDWSDRDSEPLIIQRISNQQIDWANTGITVTPSDGWTCLKVSNKNAKPTLNFVNEKQFLIAAIKPVNFPEWPPTFLEKKRGGDSNQQRRIATQIDSEQYKHIVVEWFLLQHLAYGTYRDGRIRTDRQEFMIRIMSQRGYTDEQIDAITRLCDQLIGTQ